MFENFISFETAKLVKKAGYDEKTKYHFDLDSGELRECVSVHFFNSYTNGLGAFLQSEIQSWLRKEYNIVVEVYTRQKYLRNRTNIPYKFRLIVGRVIKQFSDKLAACNTYEEALEAGLKEGLKELGIN